MGIDGSDVKKWKEFRASDAHSDKKHSITTIFIKLTSSFLSKIFNYSSKEHPENSVFENEDRYIEQTDETHKNLSFHCWKNIDYSVQVASRLKIFYKTFEGKKTEREIDIKYYDGTVYLNAYCLLRKESRTFRIDRVESCIDRDTGEYIKDIPLYLWKKYQVSPIYKLNKFYEKEKDLLRALHYIAKADGQLRKEEREIIISVCKTLLNDNTIPNDSIDTMINTIDRSSIHAFKLCIGRLAKEKKENLKLLFIHGKKIIETQKKIHPSETEALEYIEKKLSTI